MNTYDIINVALGSELVPQKPLSQLSEDGEPRSLVDTASFRSKHSSRYLYFLAPGGVVVPAHWATEMDPRFKPCLSLYSSCLQDFDHPLCRTLEPIISRLYAHSGFSDVGSACDQKAAAFVPIGGLVCHRSPSLIEHASQLEAQVGGILGAYKGSGGGELSSVAKAQTLTHADLQISVAEIGAGQETAKLLLGQDPHRDAVFMSVTSYSREASDARYGEDIKDPDTLGYINPSRLDQQLAKEYSVMDSIAKKRKAVISNTMRTSSRNGHGWIGYMGELTVGGRPVKVKMHVRLFQDSSGKQKDATGKLGVNLAYALNSPAIRENPDRFFKALKEGFLEGDIEIDAISLEGEALAHLQGTATSKLLEHNLAKKVLVSKEGRSIAGQSLSLSRLEGLKKTLVSSDDELMGSEKHAAPATEGVRVWDPHAHVMKAVDTPDVVETYLAGFAPEVGSRRNPQVIDGIIHAKDSPMGSKIRAMNAAGFIQGTVVEVGSSKLSDELFGRPFVPVFESASLRFTDLRSRYHGLSSSSSLTEDSIAKMLDEDYDRVTPTPPRPDAKQVLRKYAIIKTLEKVPGKEPLQYMGWVALKGQFVPGPDGVPVQVIVKFIASSGTDADKLATQIAVNLWHSFGNPQTDPLNLSPERFFDPNFHRTELTRMGAALGRLTDGVAPGELQSLQIKVSPNLEPAYTPHPRPEFRPKPPEGLGGGSS